MTQAGRCFLGRDAYQGNLEYDGGMDIDYDSEFIDTGRLIHPISIGFVRDDGEELYRIWDTPLIISGAVVDPWHRENTVPSLPLIVHDEVNWEWDENHPDIECVKDKKEIRQDVEYFLHEASVKGGDLRLWAWYAAYDHVLLAQIWGKMIDFPSWMPMFSHDIKQEHVRLGEPELPRQKDGVHNALADARHNRVRREALREIERIEKGRESWHNAGLGHVFDNKEQ